MCLFPPGLEDLEDYEGDGIGKEGAGTKPDKPGLVMLVLLGRPQKEEPVSTRYVSVVSEELYRELRDQPGDCGQARSRENKG